MVGKVPRPATGVLLNPFRSLAPQERTRSLAAGVNLEGRGTTPITRWITGVWILRPASGATTGLAASAACDFLQTQARSFCINSNAALTKHDQQNPQ